MCNNEIVIDYNFFFQKIVSCFTNGRQDEVVDDSIIPVRHAILCYDHD